MAWKSWAKAGSSRRGRTAASIWNMPVKSTPKPRSICPTSRRRSPLASIKRRIPAIAMAGARVVGAMRRSRKPPSPPLRRRIWAVTVVPMLAPMMTPMAWRSFITRAFTRPTTMTVAAEEDWMEQMAQFGLERNIPKMEEDLKKYGIQYDQWFLESSLHNSGYVGEPLQNLFQPSLGGLFQAPPQHRHPVQEEGQPAEQADKSKKVQIQCPP